MARPTLTQDQAQSLCDEYVAGSSARKAGEKYGVTPSTVLYHLKRRGIKSRPLIEAIVRKHSVNHEFFNVIDTEAKAYWLGFIYADGCICDGASFYLSITLAKKDEAHLRLFKTHVETTAPIHSGHRKAGGMINGRVVGATDWVALHVSSKRLCQGLINLGCGPRKSLTIGFPTLDQVPDHLLHHFIRGYFDGDGSVNSSVRGTGRQYRVKLVGTPDFLEGCLSYLEKRGIRRISIGLDCVGGKISRINYGGNYNIQQIYEILYKDATVWLERKRERFEACKAQPTAPSNGYVKTYSLKSPTGEIHTITNMAKWCREQRLGNHRWFYAVASGERPSHKGWILVSS